GGGLAEGHHAGEVEGELARVDVVALAVEQRRPHVDEREAVAPAAREALAQAVLDLGDVLARHGSALDRVDELQVPARRRDRLELDPHDRVLAAPARLLDEPRLRLERAPQALL